MRKRIARNVQPEIIDRLFIEQSEPWEKLARSHSKSVWEATQEFMDSVITHLTDEYTADALILDIIGPKMDDRSVARGEAARTALVVPEGISNHITITSRTLSRTCPDERMK